MNKLAHLEPREVFAHFEEICAIPHGSYDTKKISDYCVTFAKEHALEYRQDKENNVVIIKGASEGYEDAQTIMIQGHLDMVCEKLPDKEIDFKKDGLSIYAEGDFIKADGTTLGGDDGIAVAFALALLADKTLKHPRLEVVFTTEEEVGMEGAKALDTSDLKASRLLNLDSEEEGILLTSCAGGFKGTCRLPVRREKAAGEQIALTVGGLLGGHSGMEIIKGRVNSNKMMARLLVFLSRNFTFSLTGIAGGLKDNAIPKETKAEIILAAAECESFLDAVKKFEKHVREEYRNTDPGIEIRCIKRGEGEASCISREDQEKVLLFLNQSPDGVQKMSADISGLVQTSLNLGILNLEEEELTAGFAVRSSMQTEKEELGIRLESFIKYLGGSYEIYGDYPAWEYRADSPLRDTMVQVYERMYGEKPKVEAVHAGLECGILSSKMKGIDCVSFGPDIFDVHTVDEKLSISSTKRTWDYFIQVLEACR